jgi:hypothetical protein
MHTYRYAPLVLIALGVLAGCTREDKQRLTRVGDRVGAKVDAMAGGPRDKLGDGWQVLLAGWEQVSLDVRVAARLRWEKSLEGCSIQVHADGEAVELTGTVRNLEQRRRAVELAGSTAGVKQVVDQLQLPATP